MCMLLGWCWSRAQDVLDGWCDLIPRRHAIPTREIWSAHFTVLPTDRRMALDNQIGGEQPCSFSCIAGTPYYCNLHARSILAQWCIVSDQARDAASHPVLSDTYKMLRAFTPAVLTCTTAFVGVLAGWQFGGSSNLTRPFGLTLLFGGRTKNPFCIVVLFCFLLLNMLDLLDSLNEDRHCSGPTNHL